MEKIYTLLFLPFLLFISSCSLDSVRENIFKEGENGYNFRESKAAWDDLKKKNGNSYEYTFLEESWTGVGSETTILIERGKVVGRYYEAFIISAENGTKTITDTYEETSRKEIGSHAAGAPPLSMDDLYKTCISQYLTVDPDANEVYFETNETGVMILCGFSSYGCNDDCYLGIRISKFIWR